MKSKKQCCNLCGQLLSVYTTYYKDRPFIDNKSYNKLCFTCFAVPKVSEQILTKDGLIKEEKELPFCCRYLHTPKELLEYGSADSLKEAKICVNAIQTKCQKIKNPKEYTKPTKINWQLA